MNQRDYIRQLLSTLPLPQQQRIEREAAKHRAKRPLDMAAFWEEFKAIHATEAPLRAKDLERRKKQLEKLDGELRNHKSP